MAVQGTVRYRKAATTEDGADGEVRGDGGYFRPPKKKKEKTKT